MDGRDAWYRAARGGRGWDPDESHLTPPVQWADRCSGDRARGHATVFTTDAGDTMRIGQGNGEGASGQAGRQVSRLRTTDFGSHHTPRVDSDVGFEPERDGMVCCAVPPRFSERHTG